MNKGKYIKKSTKETVEAKQEQDGGVWWLKHKDGCETRLSDKKFRQRYEAAQE